MIRTLLLVVLILVLLGAVGNLRGTPLVYPGGTLVLVLVVLLILLLMGYL